MAKFLNEEQIRTEFINYLIKRHSLDEDEAKFAACDFPDPFANCYLISEYECNVQIEGKEYKMYSCKTDFCRFDTFSDKVSPFKFNIYYYFEDKKITYTVGEYREAPKLYELKSRRCIK